MTELSIPNNFVMRFYINMQIFIVNNVQFQGSTMIIIYKNTLSFMQFLTSFPQWADISGLLWIKPEAVGIIA